MGSGFRVVEGSDMGGRELMAFSRASLRIHTRSDDIDQLDLRGFEQAGQVALKVIQALLHLPRDE